MPKTVTQDLQDQQAKRQQKFWKRFYLYRRQWNAGETKYEYEETAIEITDWVISSGNLSWQLDTVALNIWKESNVSIVVKNKKDEWSIDDRDGIFYNKQAKDSKIQIKVGNILPDGTEDLIYIYTGIVKDIVRNYKNQTATIYLLGYSDILNRYSAEDLSDNQVTGETLGTGDGSTTEFFTDEKGVGKIKKVYIDGVEKVVPTDYSISQLNDKDNYAKITFVTAPSSGTITSDYVYWYQEKKIEYLVKKLLESAGITSANYEVQNAVFDNAILVHQIWDTQGEFNACQTKQELEVLEEGSVRQTQTDWLETITAHFATGVIKDNIDTANDELKLASQISDETNLALNKSRFSGGYQASWDDVPNVNDGNWDNYARGFTSVNADPAYIGCYCSPVGTLKKVQMKFHIDRDPTHMTLKIEFYDGSVWRTLDSFKGTSGVYYYNKTYEESSGYAYHIYRIKLTVIPDAGYSCYVRAYEMQAFRWKWVTGHFRSQEKTLGSNSCFGNFYESHLAGQTYVFKVRRKSGANWSDWLTISNEQKIDLTPGEKIQYDVVLTSVDYTTNPKVYDVKCQYVDQGYTDTHCKLMTQNIDCGVDLQVFNLFEHWQLLYGKWLTFYTQSAPDDEGSPGEWESEVEINGNGQIESTCTPGTTRFLRCIVYFKTDDATVRPLLQKIKLNWNTSTVEITLADFSSMTVKKAIEKLAEMPDYEVGIGATGKFFFRKKSVDTNVDYVLEKGRNVSELLKVDDGFGRVRNYIEANFGDYSKVMSVRLEGETRPDSIDKYGEKRLIVSGGNLLAAGNIDIATGIAMRYYGFYSSNYSLTSFNYPSPKLRCKVKSKFVPQIDLGDTVSLTFPTLKEEKYAHLFDGWAFNNYVFGTSSLAFNEELMKVIGIVLNLEHWYMELDLEEL